MSENLGLAFLGMAVITFSVLAIMVIGIIRECLYMRKHGLRIRPWGIDR